MTSKIRIWLLAGLIIFLPLSAWLVSASGNYLVSLGRDILLFLFIATSLIDWRSFKKPNWLIWPIVLFILFTLTSFFGRQDSTGEWLRGVRYLIEPAVLFGTIICFPLPEGAKKPLSIALLASLVIVLIGAGIDYFHPEWLRLSLAPGARGFLGEIHLASNLPRLQSVLAGPNALGLFLLVILLLAPLWQKYCPKWLAIILALFGVVAIVLTFSRSSYLGLLAGGIYLLIAGARHIANSRRWLAAVVLAVIIAGSSVAILKPDFLTRAASNNARFEQYQRIWRERSDIGLFGRGAGTAGPFSDHSFDNQPTYFSENTYLDVFENIGLFGALAYVTFWVGLIATSLQKRTLNGATIAAAAFGLTVAGFFIDHFTGQAAVWLTLITAGWLYRSGDEDGGQFRRSSNGGEPQN